MVAGYNIATGISGKEKKPTEVQFLGDKFVENAKTKKEALNKFQLLIRVDFFYL